MTKYRMGSRCRTSLRSCRRRRLVAVRARRLDVVKEAAAFAVVVVSVQAPDVIDESDGRRRVVSVLRVFLLLWMSS